MYRIIYGLGNPGPSYHNTRHNVGKDLIDRWAKALDASWQSQGKVWHARARYEGLDFILVKSQGFMNLSGQDFQPFLRFYKARIDEVLVWHDDVESDFGLIKYRHAGANLGHNGLRDLDAHAGKDYGRIRIGVGRPLRGTVADWVLGAFSKDEQAVLDLLGDCVVNLSTRVCQDKSHKPLDEACGQIRD